MGFTVLSLRRYISRSATLIAATLIGATLVAIAPLQAQVSCDLPGHSFTSSCSCPGCDAFFSSVTEATPDVLHPAPSVVSPESSDSGAVTMPAPVAAPSIDQLATGSFASSFGAVAGGTGVPSMIGDFFGGNFNYLQFPGDPVSGNNAIGNNATVAIAGGDRQLKWAENNSPFPQDRVFFNYHHFHNAVIGSDSRSHNVDRFTFGLEKTFLDGDASLEVRVPFASTITSSPSIFDPSRVMDTEFGNISLAIKGLLYREGNFATAIGLGIVLPSGDDFVVESNVSNHFENGAVHLQPFLGVFYSPSQRVFTQFFTQIDFDAGSSEVLIGELSDELNQQSLLMLDYSIGYWLSQGRRGCVRAIAPMLELHYTTSIEDQDYGVFSGQGIFVQDYRRDVLNVTGGLFFQLGRMSSLKVGAVAPLRNGSDKLFDSEFGLQFVRNY